MLWAFGGGGYSCTCTDRWGRWFGVSWKILMHGTVKADIIISLAEYVKPVMYKKISSGETPLPPAAVREPGKLLRKDGPFRMNVPTPMDQQNAPLVAPNSPPKPSTSHLAFLIDSGRTFRPMFAPKRTHAPPTNPLAHPLPPPPNKSQTHDLLLSPSRLNPSIIFNISFRPAVASTFLPPKLISAFPPVPVRNSFLTSKCRMRTQTKTPQSLELSCCGASSRSTKRTSLPSSWAILWAASAASPWLDGRMES